VVIAADNATFSIAEVRWGLTAAIIAPRSLRVEAFAGQPYSAANCRTPMASLSWHDDRRGQAPAHLGDRERGVVGGDHHVAGGDEPGAAAEAAALPPALPSAPAHG